MSCISLVLSLMRSCSSKICLCRCIISCSGVVLSNVPCVGGGALYSVLYCTVGSAIKLPMLSKKTLSTFKALHTSFIRSSDSALLPSNHLATVDVAIFSKPAISF